VVRPATVERAQIAKQYLEYIEKIGENQAGKLQVNPDERIGTVRRRLNYAAKLAGKSLTIERVGDDELYFWVEPPLNSDGKNCVNPGCGLLLADNASVCAICGTRQPSTETPTAPGAVVRPATVERAQIVKQYLEYIEKIGENQAGKLQANPDERIGTVQRRLNYAAKLAGKSLTIERVGDDELYFWVQPPVESPQEGISVHGRVPPVVSDTPQIGVENIQSTPVKPLVDYLKIVTRFIEGVVGAIISRFRLRTRS
jgi:hypothetical protein